jgi:hypothetical protein
MNIERSWLFLCEWLTGGRFIGHSQNITLEERDL